MSTGEVLRVRAAMKPIATVPRALRTVDVATGEATVAHHQRSDVCAVPAAGIVAEAMVALVLADAVLEKFGGDSVQRDPPQRRGLPRHPEVPVTASPRRAGRADGRRQDHRRRPARRGLGRCRCATPTPTSRPPRDARSPTSSSTTARTHFRALEATAVADALAAHDGVLALGGGAVLDPATRDAARRPPGGVPARRPRRRGEAGRPRDSAGRCCSATCGPGSRRCSTSAPRSTRRSRRLRRRHRRPHPRGGRRRDPGASRSAMSDATVLHVAGAVAVRRGRRPRPARPAAGHPGRRRAPGRRALLRRGWPSWRSRRSTRLVRQRTTCSPSGCPTARRAKTAAVAARLLGRAGRARLHPLRRGRVRSAGER